MGPFPSSQQAQPPQFQQQGTGAPQPHSPHLGFSLGPAYPIWKRQTAIQPAVQPPPMPLVPPLMPNTLPPSPVTPLTPLLVDPLNATPPPATTAPRTRSRIVAIILLCLLAGGLYFVWHRSPSPSSSSTPSVTQQNFSGASTSSGSNGASNTSSTGTIQVYITGAVKHPGVYTLAQGARVHDLLSAAGGPLPQANLVALNLVAKLSDGQEVYVTVQGETPPSYVGGVPAPGSGTGNSSGNATNTGNTGNTACVNVNTASADDMRLNLHISSASAQAIINYRLQHGDYQSVQELANVVSKTIYDKIKGTACVS